MPCITDSVIQHPCDFSPISPINKPFLVLVDDVGEHFLNSCYYGAADNLVQCVEQCDRPPVLELAFVLIPFGQECDDSHPSVL